MHFGTLTNSADLHDEQVIQDMQESLAQIERGETYDQDEVLNAILSLFLSNG